MNGDLLTSIYFGVCFGAACGFRSFLPALLYSIALATGHAATGPAFAWLGSSPAIILFGLGAAIEIVESFRSSADRLLDLVWAPLAMVIASLLTLANLRGPGIAEALLVPLLAGLLCLAVRSRRLIAALGVVAFSAALGLGIALMFIFLSIEMGPIFFKMMMNKGPYDYMVENHNYRMYVRNGIVKEEMIFEGRNGMKLMEKINYLEVENDRKEKVEKLKAQELSINRDLQQNSRRVARGGALCGASGAG